MKTAPPRANRTWNVLKILFALVLAGYVLYLADVRQLPGLFQGISGWWLAAATLLFLPLTLLKALQYHFLIRESVSYPQVLNVVVMQNAVSNYLASGAGIISYLTLLRVDHDVRLSRSVAIFLLTKIGDLFALWLFLLASAFLLWNQIRELYAAVIGLLALMGLVLGIFLLTLIFRRKFVNWIRLGLERFKLLKVRGVRAGVDFLTALAEMEHGGLFGRLAVVGFLSIVYLGTSTLWSYVVFRVFNFHVVFSQLLFINVLLQLISYFPIQVLGGLGVSEASSLYLWGLLGVSQATLAPVLVGNRILFYLLNLLPLVYLPIYAIFSERKQRPQDG